MSAYQQLTKIFQRLARLDHLSAITGWDMQTMMPTGGSEARGRALAELSVIRHELLTQSLTGELLDKALQESLDPVQQANLYEMNRQFQASALIPADLVEAQALAGSHCEQAWRLQRKENDWQGFSKNLKPVVDLARQEAQIRAQVAQTSAYDALLNLYEPGMTSCQLDNIFGDLTAWLPEMLQQIAQRQATQPLTPIRGHFPIEQQKVLAQSVMQLLGFDFTHGRLDVSVHPFCGGVPEDVRITTRYNESEFLSALMGVVHETGHARYEQNLPAQWAEQPIALARSTAIHESQSLFMEMQLARSQEFVQLVYPRIQQHLTATADMTFSQLLQQVQHVQPGYIRVDADEVSYPAHVMLRYEIEKSLINGDIQVDDIPELWDQQMFKLLGLRTAGNYREGCMQDIHWTDGAFGYFPTYTLGAMYAAQLFQSLIQQQPRIRENIAAGELQPVFDWLKQNIWSQGSRYSVRELMINATGEDLNPLYFKKHLTERYLSA